MKPATGLAGFIARVLSNENRNLFTVRLGVALILAKFGIVGFPARVVGFLFRGFLGVLIEDGTFIVDVALDAYREGRKLEEFKEMASKAYDKATAKIYDEEQKNAIRKEYLDIISRIGIVGNPKSDKLRVGPSH